jgi:hypothetical protein
MPGANVFELIIIINQQMSFGGGYCKMRVDNDIGSAVNTVKHAVARMVATIPVITIKDEEDELDARVGYQKKKT